MLPEIESYVNLLESEPRIQGFDSLIINPYSKTYLKVTTNISNFMKKNNYIGIVSTIYPLLTGSNAIGEQVVHSLLNTGLNGETLFVYSSTSEDGDPESYIEENVSFIKDLVKKKDLKLLYNDIAFTLDSMLKRQDMSDPASYYSVQDLGLFKINGNWYLGSTDTENQTVELFKFISAERFSSFAKDDVIPELGGDPEGDFVNQILLNASKDLQFTQIAKKEFTQDVNIFSSDNPAVVTMALGLHYWGLDEPMMSNTLVGKDLETFQKLNQSAIKLAKSWE